MTYSIMMIRDEDQLIPARYICQFFKFCGIYTYDFIMLQQAEGSGFPDCFGFDCVVLMTRQGNVKTALKISSAQNVVEFCVPADMDLSGREKRNAFGKESRTKVLETVGNGLADTYDVFVDTDVAYLNFMSHWNPVLDRLDEWMSVCDKQSFDGCVQQRYSYLNCCRQVNKICAECRRIAVFDDSKLIAAAVKLYEEDKKFTIAYVLAGLIGLRNPDTERQAEQYLPQAVEREKGIAYADFVYYILGEHYEFRRHDWMFGWMWYHQMAGCPLQERGRKPVADDRYSIKLAKRMIQTGQADEAWKVLTGMNERLEKKHARGYISLDEISAWYQCARTMEDMHRFFGNKYVLTGMLSDSIVGAINRNTEIWNFTDENSRQDILQSVKKKIENRSPTG